MNATALEMCSGAQNDTVLECPINKTENRENTEFIVVVHNSATKTNKQLVRIRLPHKSYRAQVWSKTAMEFQDVVSDVFEQFHFNNHGEK